MYPRNLLIIASFSTVVACTLVIAFISEFCITIPTPISLSVIQPYVPEFNLACFFKDAGATEQPEGQKPWNGDTGMLNVTGTLQGDTGVASGATLSTMAPSPSAEF